MLQSTAIFCSNNSCISKCRGLFSNSHNFLFDDNLQFSHNFWGKLLNDGKSILLQYHKMTVHNHCMLQFDLFLNSNNCLIPINKELITNQMKGKILRNFQFFCISENFLFRKLWLFTTTKWTLTITMKIITSNVCHQNLLQLKKMVNFFFTIFPNTIYTYVYIWVVVLTTIPIKSTYYWKWRTLTDMLRLQPKTSQRI